MLPPNVAPVVDGEGARHLPARAALGRAIPDILPFAELQRVVEGDGVHQMPGRGHAEAEEGVQVALLVDDDAHIPIAADLHHPALRGLGRRMRDGDEIDIFVFVGELREGLEGLFGDYGRRRGEC